MTRAHGSGGDPHDGDARQLRLHAGRGRDTGDGHIAAGEPPELVEEITVVDGAAATQIALQQAPVLREVSTWSARPAARAA